jgi:hypothetical protein
MKSVNADLGMPASFKKINEGREVFRGVVWDWVHLVRRLLTGLLYQPRTIDDECGAVGGMRIGRGNLSTRRKPVLVPLCPPQIPHDLTWTRTRAAAVWSRRLTAWAMARPPCLFSAITDKIYVRDGRDNKCQRTRRSIFLTMY